MEEANIFLEKRNKKNIYNIITIIGVGNVGRAAAERAILLGYQNINLASLRIHTSHHHLTAIFIF